MCSSRKCFAAVLAIALSVQLLAATPAAADKVTTSPPTMADLLTPGPFTPDPYLEAGDVIFNNFRNFVSIASAGLTPLTADDVFIHTSVDGDSVSLTVQVPILANAGEFYDIGFEYDAMIKPGSSLAFNGHFLNASGSGSNGGVIIISDVLTDEHGNSLANPSPIIALGDGAPNGSSVTYTTVFDLPQTFVSSNKDIFVSGGNGFAFLSHETQEFRFELVPEPSSIMLSLMGSFGSHLVRVPHPQGTGIGKRLQVDPYENSGSRSAAVFYWVIAAILYGLPLSLDGSL